eukprot:1267406-Pyramimonas_sp.AAC.1
MRMNHAQQLLALARLGDVQGLREMVDRVIPTRLRIARGEVREYMNCIFPTGSPRSSTTFATRNCDAFHEYLLRYREVNDIVNAPVGGREDDEFTSLLHAAVEGNQVGYVIALLLSIW